MRTHRMAVALNAAIASLRDTIEREGPETVGAFLVEPVQGAGGVLIPPDDYLAQARQVCDEYGILLVANEIITGFGRTGKMFAMENWGVEPDLLTFAKGATSGYMPLGGVIITDRIHDVLKERSEGTLFHGFTYSGHPTAAAVALKNIEIIEQEKLVQNSREMGDALLLGFQNMKKEIDIVGDVRTKGLLGAVELVRNSATNERFTSNLKVASRVTDALHQRGVICRAVTYNNTDIICFAPPIIINQVQINKLVDKLHDAIQAIQKELNQVL